MPRRIYTELYDLTEIRSMYWNNMPTARIARLVNLDRSTVRRILLKSGFPPHTRASANRFLAAERTDGERQRFAQKAADQRKANAKTSSLANV